MSINKTYQNIQQRLQDREIKKSNIDIAEIVSEATTNGNEESIPEAIYDWDRKAIDFGWVAPGSTQKYSFTYVGNNKIISVMAGCGCTSAIVDGNTISGVLTLGKDFSYSKDRYVAIDKNVMVTMETPDKESITDTLTLFCKVDKLGVIPKQ